LKERNAFLIILAVFLPHITFLFRSRNPEIRAEAFLMLQEYAQEHVLTCLIPALFIAGAIAVFVSQAAVMKYFGAGAKKILAYSVASVSGTILAVVPARFCPFCRNLYAGGESARDILSLFRTGNQCPGDCTYGRSLVGSWVWPSHRAVGFAYLIGLCMHFIYRKEEKNREAKNFYLPDRKARSVPYGKIRLHGDLGRDSHFCRLGKAGESVGFWMAVWR